MLEISFNGKQLKISASLSLSELLNNNGFYDSCFAVAINRVFVPKSSYVNVVLKSNDIIDVITPMQGG